MGRARQRRRPSCGVASRPAWRVRAAGAAARRSPHGGAVGRRPAAGATARLASRRPQDEQRAATTAAPASTSGAAAEPRGDGAPRRGRLRSVAWAADGGRRRARRPRPGPARARWPRRLRTRSPCVAAATSSWSVAIDRSSVPPRRQQRAAEIVGHGAGASGSDPRGRRASARSRTARSLDQPGRPGAPRDPASRAAILYSAATTVSARDRLLAGEQLVQDEADREEVAAAVELAARHLLGRHVVRRPDQRAAGRGAEPGEPGDAEVHDLGRPPEGRNTFEGFTSRCTMPCSWAWPSPASICSTSGSVARGSGRMPPSIACGGPTPSSSSRAMNGAPSCSPSS